ncbi:MAG: hypothetical protein KIT60_14320 [Burkholderiaceae bacterium]|nr:hypothetical protein [Burkholderiaceae bacterium]
MPFVEGLEETLLGLHKSDLPMPGIAPFENRAAFVMQVLDGVRRVEYVKRIRSRTHSGLRADPASPIFDPLRAALLHFQSGEVDEAWWLVFLATHSGKHLHKGWRLSAELYGALGSKQRWDWHAVSKTPTKFEAWLAENEGQFIGKFGNHRKYESLKPTDSGTGAVVRSYVDWVRKAGSHEDLVKSAIKKVGPDPRALFAHLYDEMRNVKRFGRTARFDFLTMIAKVGLASIEADKAYLEGATGPLRGARLLFDGAIGSGSTAINLEARVAKLNTKVPLGMQVWEDSMCNWQKSPSQYIAFRG